MALNAEQKTVIRSALDPSGWVEGSRQIQQEAQKTAQVVTGANEQVTQSITKTTRALVDGGGAYQRVAGQIDPVIRAQQTFARQQDIINRAVSVGRTTQEEANRLLSLAAAKYGIISDSAREATARMEAMAAAASRATTFQAQINQSLGISLPGQSANRSADIAAYGTELDRLRAKFNPMFAASKQYEDELNEIAQAQKVGAISAHEATAAHERATAAFAAANAPLQNLTKSVAEHSTTSSRAAYATRDLGLQSIDFFQGIATGQPILRSFIQQGAQVAQVNAASGVSLREMGGYMAGLIGPTTLVIGAFAAVTAGIVAVSIASERSATRLHDMQNALRATREDYASLAQTSLNAARNVAGSSGLSTDTARTFARTIGGSAGFSGTQADLERLIRVSADLDAVFGKAGTGAEMLARSMTDPGKVAQDLASQRFPGMSQALAYQIKLMADAGDRNSAYARTLDVLKAGTAGAAQPATELGRALERLSNAFTRTGDDGRSFADKLGGFFTSIAAHYIDYLTWLIEKASGIIDTVGKLPSLFGGGTGGTGAAGTAAGGAVGGGVAAQITDLGGRLGLTPQQIAFGQRVAYQESGGQQFSMFGAVKTSSAGAMGVMGLMPGTAADLGVNAADPTENIAGGLAYIGKLWNKYGGNPGLVAMAYNWGPGNVDKFLDGRKSLADVPRETSSYVRAVAGVDIGTLGGAGVIDVSGNSRGRLQASYDAAQLAYQNSGALSRQIAENSAEQQLLQRGIQAAGAFGDAAAAKHYAEVLAEVRGKASDLITEQQRLARSAQDAVGPLSAQAGATRTLAQIEQTFAETARRAGTGVDRRALLQAQTAELVKLSTAYNDQVADLQRATEAQNRINEAWDGGVASLAHLQNVEKARAEALKSFIPGTDAYTDAVTRYTAALDQNWAANENTRQITAASAELANSVSRSFDTIGDAIVNAFVSGQGAAVSFRNVLTSVASEIVREFIKLAAINPLLNELFPGSGHRTTFSDVLDSLSKTTPGSTSGGSSGGGSGAVGAIGSIIGIVGKIASLWSGVPDPIAINPADVGNALPNGAGSMFGLAGHIHGGGLVGYDPPTFHKPVSSSVFHGAQRFHGGLGLNSDEFPAILQRGERVLTEPQQRKVVAAANDGGRPTVININLPGNVRDTDTFRKAAPQIIRSAMDAQARTARRG